MSGVTRTLKLGWYNLTMRWQAETAYFGSNWSNMFSTTAYTATVLLSLEFIFRKVPDIAGMNRNQVVFMFIICQIAFYISMIFTTPSITKLAEDVRNGRLDMLLTKPLPITWSSITSNASLLGLIRDIAPAVIPYPFIARFTGLGLTWQDVVAGVVIFILGIVIDMLVFHALALTTVWHNADENIVRMYSYVSRAGGYAPYDAYPQWFKWSTFVFFPSFLAAFLSSAVMMGRLPAEFWLGAVFLAAGLAMLMYKIIIVAAIRSYGSASS